MNTQFATYNGHRHPSRPSRRTLVDRLSSIAPPRSNFAIAAHSLDIDANTHIIFRNLACFNGKEMFIIGSQRWFRGATNGLEDHIPVTYCKTPTAFMQQARAAGYALVSVELSERAIDIAGAVYPENPCFIFGNETFGITDDVLCRSDLIVQIPMNGLHPCLNVGVSSGIVVYDYLSKLR